MNWMDDPNLPEPPDHPLIGLGLFFALLVLFVVACDCLWLGG